MIHLLAVALGGALGAMARYWLSGRLDHAGQPIPINTLSINVLGSFLMGVCFVLILEKGRLPPDLRPLLMVGFLGAFTTFPPFPWKR